SVLEPNIAEAGAERKLRRTGVTPVATMDNVARQFVADHLDRSLRAVAINVQTRGAAAAVVRHRQMRPLAGRYHVLSLDADRIPRPEMNQREHSAAAVENE